MRRKRTNQVAWDTLGVAIFVVMIFPVFWMVSTAFKPEDQVNGLTPTWLSLHPTLQHFRDAMQMPFFWNDVVNTIIVVCVA
ncbi:MAG: N,N-diacetylchitobiose transport system permease protein, partial [Gaiellaceae bacterium]|nr:N,N-diacetylchitobiose transport system permease protein [Gaiellaceae bacterium]